MFTLLSLLACAAAEVNPYWPDGMPYDYQIRYSTLPEKQCASGLTAPMEVKFIGTGAGEVPIYLHQCAYKCSNGCASNKPTETADVTDMNGNTVADVECACGGMEATDDNTVFSVCGSEALCKDLCDASPECYGIHMSRDKDRCFLLKEQCQQEALHGDLEASATYDYIAKMDPESRGGVESCPMGVAVDVNRLVAPAGVSCSNRQINDQYDPDGTGSGYKSECSSINWHGSGCGWVVKMTEPEADEAEEVGAVCDAPSCMNHVEAANWIFGNADDDYLHDVCTNTEPWLRNGYCTNDLWAALCPEECKTSVTCDICTEWAAENAPASAIVASMLDLVVPVDSTACAVLADDYNMCGDPVVQVVCVAACAGFGDRRLTEADASHIKSALHKYGALFQHKLDVIESDFLQQMERRLQAGGEMVDTYSTWDPTARPDWCAGDQRQLAMLAPPDENIISPSDELFNLYTWDDVVKIDVALQCPVQETYTTLEGHYCEGNNLVIDVGGVADDIKNDLCWKKCLQGGTLANSGKEDAPHFCDGMDTAFNAYSNALCIPRDVCEAHCTALGDACTGFEMARDKSRCYLNTAAPCDGDKLIASGLYDKVTKTTGDIRYRTSYKQKCDSVEASISGTRAECEAACSADPMCAGFNFDLTAGTCAMHMLGAQFNAGQFCTQFAGTFGGEVATTVNLVAASSHEQYVQKDLVGTKVTKPFTLPCLAKFDGCKTGRNALCPGGNGEYEELSAADDSECAGQGTDCYVHPDKLFRFVWAQQDTYDESAGAGENRKCDGWIMQNRVDMDSEWTSEYVTFPSTVCESSAQSAIPTEGYPHLYRFAPDLFSRARINHMCKSYPVCGTTSTCVLAKRRFGNELTLAYGTSDHSEALIGGDLIKDLPADDKANFLDDVTYRPKTLITVERAVSFVAQAKWQWGAEIYRNVPGHLRVRIRSPGANLDKAVITMVSSVPAESMMQLGVEYVMNLPGYAPLYTDIVRVETFAKEGMAGSPMHLDFYAPNVPQLILFRATANLAGQTVFTEVTGITAAADYAGWWKATITEDGDYVGTTELPCPSTPPTVDDSDVTKTPKMCMNTDPGDTCGLVCKKSFIKAGDFTCSKGQWTTPGDGAACAEPEDYTPETQLFTLSHRSRLDYGWRIRQVNVFSDAACSSNKKINAKVTHVGTSGEYSSDFSSDSLYKGTTLKQETQCETNGNSCDDWWSKDLNVNPYSVDETHGSAVYITFTVDASSEVQCVQVISRTKDNKGMPRQYYPTEMTLHRGWSDNSNVRQLEQGISAMEDNLIRTDGWTTAWEATSKESLESEVGLTTTFATQCGVPSQRIIGELIKEVDGVPSSCHCQQLCIDMIHEDCRTWNYEVNLGSCYLQSDIKQIAGEQCDQGGSWISGDTGLRLTGVSNPTVSPGDSFDLGIEGVNLPTDASAKMHGTTPLRQRIKIIEVMDSNTPPRPNMCAEAEIAKTVKGIGCSHPYFCAPKPSETDIDGATWSGITINSSPDVKQYKVCYNRGFTYDRWQWHEVPVDTASGHLEVDANQYAWSTNPATLTRKTTSFDLTVDGGAFQDGTAWVVRLVRSYFDCNEVHTDVATFGGVLSGTRTEVHNDVATPLLDSGSVWKTINIYDTGNEVFADVGDYKVCVASKAGATYEQIPSVNGAVYLNIAAVEGDSSHPRTLFSHQAVSGRSGGTGADQTMEHEDDAPHTLNRLSHTNVRYGNRNTIKLQGHRLPALGNGNKLLLSSSGCGLDNEIDFSYDLDYSYHLSTNPLHVLLNWTSDGSTADEWAFTGGLGNLSAGTYDLCSCDNSEKDAYYYDEVDEFRIYETDPENHIWYLTDGYRCGGDNHEGTNLGNLPFTDIENSYYAAAIEQLCTMKCAKGCVGEDCFCDGYDPEIHYQEDITAADVATPFCADAALCAQLCEGSGPACGGFDLDIENNLCYLSFRNGYPGLNSESNRNLEHCQGGSGAVYKEGFEHWRITRDKSTCAATGGSGEHSLKITRKNFKRHVGTITLTQRPSINNDWVLTPGKTESIEVSGTDLDWMEDRIMIIDSTGTCGISSPTAAHTGAAKEQHQYNHWLAVQSPFVDPPHDDDEGPYVAPAAAGAAPTWNSIAGHYCPGNNLLIKDTTTAFANRHQCHRKCVKNAPCVGDDCFCDGLINGYDGPDSDALCGDEALCKSICAQIDGCYGIDMATDNNRCFLNMDTAGAEDAGSCKDYIINDQMTALTGWTFFYKQVTNNRRLERKLLANVDQGTSWNEILRFTDVSFATGGQFKVCFCDFETLGEDNYCKSASDYKIDIGTLHVSGVSCLIEDKKFQRGTCVTQFHGGLRCYPDVAPDLTVPEIAATTVVLGDAPADDDATPTISSYCLYGPEEETRHNPLCN